MRGGWFRRAGQRLIWPALLYVVSSVVVWTGFIFGSARETQRQEFAWPPGRGTAVAIVAERGCGKYYLSIAESGYGFSTTRRSSVAFFPAYPALIRFTAGVTHLSSEGAALLATSICRAIAIVVFSAYLLGRPQASERSRYWAIAVIAMMPTTMFWHAAYSEALFVALVAVFFYAMQNRAPPFIVALIAGAAVGTRLVGIALLPVVGLYMHDLYGQRGMASLRAACVWILSLWGLMAFMAELWWAFDDPLAFFHAQGPWAVRSSTFAGKVASLFTCESCVAPYLSGSPCHWSKTSGTLPAVVSLQFYNSFIVIGSVVLLGVGYAKKWLCRKEAWCVAALLFVAYCGRGFDTCMLGQGRFAAVALPLYCVAGELLARTHWCIGAAIVGVMACYLWIWAFQFAAGMPVV